MKKIRIFARERKSAKDNGVVTKFLTYSYTKDGETYYEVKFTQECVAKPTKQGYWLVEVDPETCNIKKHKPDPITGIIKNHTLWISKCDKAIHDVDYENEVKAKKQDELNEIL